jgi:glucose-fructose oxidoreductase
MQVCVGQRSQLCGRIKRRVSEKKAGPVRYAVVGLGHIAQVAVLPAFCRAGNSRLVALVAGDQKNDGTLVSNTESNRFIHTHNMESCLAQGVDVVFIALPNHPHREYAVKAAKAGVSELITM